MTAIYLELKEKLILKQETLEAFQMKTLFMNVRMYLLSKLKLEWEDCHLIFETALIKELSVQTSEYSNTPKKKDPPQYCDIL